MEPKTKGLKHQQQQHKKLLAAMLSQDSFDSVQSTAPSVTEEDIDNEDDAMELLEDLDDLRMEGVTSVLSSGSKFNQTRSTYIAEPQAKVTLNICARCARLQGDNLAEGTEDVSVASQTLEQEVSESVAPVLGEEISMESSDELENVARTTEQMTPSSISLEMAVLYQCLGTVIDWAKKLIQKRIDTDKEEELLINGSSTWTSDS
ncbi:hypothetical protein EYD10_07655 [Varanus komodoensis]|nr:hypothetical protein EYD10_07655 [Varanus komodoensis]